MEEGLIIATSISKAKDWAVHQGINIPASETDEKLHGKDQYVIPHKNGWAVKSELAKRASKVFQDKKDAINYGKELARKYHTGIIVQSSTGKISEKISYNK